MEIELDFFDQLDKADRERELEERGCGPEKTFRSVEEQIKTKEEQDKKLREQKGNNLNTMSLKNIQESIKAKEEETKNFLEKNIPKIENGRSGYYLDPFEEIGDDNDPTAAIRDRDNPSEEYYGRYRR